MGMGRKWIYLAAGEHVIVDKDVVAPEFHAVFHIREEPSDPRRQVDDVGRALGLEVRTGGGSVAEVAVAAVDRRGREMVAVSSRVAVPTRQQRGAAAAAQVKGAWARAGVGGEAAGVVQRQPAHLLAKIHSSSTAWPPAARSASITL